MKVPAPHPQEAERLSILGLCAVLDTPAEPEFDGLTRLAASIAQVPIALVSLVDADRQWFKARCGLDAPETPRAVSFCGHAILAPEPLIVEDARQDARFFDNPLVHAGPNVVFYVGIPLRAGPAALPVGTLCVVDHRPRAISEDCLAQLRLLGRQVEILLELRLRQRDLEEQLAARRRGEAELQALVSTMEEGLIEQTSDGVIVSSNPAAERILGLSKDQMMGRTPMDPRWQSLRTDGSDFREQEHPTMVALRTGQPVRGVVMGVGTDDDNRRWIHVNAQPSQFDASGRAVRVIASFSDITALRGEEAERRRAEAQVERFFTLSLELLCIANVNDGHLLRINPAWTTVLGWSEQELLSKPYSEFLHPDDREAAMRQIVKLREGATVIGFENRNLCRDGSYRILRWGATCSEGMLMAIARDVTEERARNAELMRARDAAEAATRAKSEFLATMSHEIRTPMNGVLGLTELLLGTRLDAEQREMLRSVHDSGQALLQILNDVLDWSRIEAGRLELQSSAVDVSRLAHDVMTVFGPQGRAKGLELVVEQRGEKTALALGDAGRIRQILFNVAGNAIKFTEQGRVAISIEHTPVEPALPEGGIRICVVDTGIGMAPEAIEKLFERFSQVDASVTRRFTGSGLGLAISRKLARAMGGDIGVRSRLGSGSVFTVTLPAAANAASQPAPRPSQSVRPSARPMRVLVAEDNLVNQKVAAALLTRDGHYVEVASNGVAAVAAFKRGNWDLVLMDVQMPEMDGLSAARAIRDYEQESGLARVPVFALTASAMPEERSACITAGMDEVLAKPITGAALRRVLQSVA